MPTVPLMNETNFQRIWQSFWRSPSFPPDALGLAKSMVSAFKILETQPDRLSQAFALAAQCLGLSEGLPLLHAGTRMARDMDSGIGAGDGNAYHNRQHFAEVLLSTLVLGRVHGLTGEPFLRLLVAAMAHDFHHDGQANGAEAFRLETRAANAMGAYLREAGVRDPEIKRATALVLATEYAIGAPFARACHHYHRGETESLPDQRSLPAPLHLLQTDPALAMAAVLLAEADILPSVGLTIAHSTLCEQRLAQEWRGKPTNMDGKLQFLNKAMENMVFSRHFQSNMEILRAQLQNPDPAAGRAAAH